MFKHAAFLALALTAAAAPSPAEGTAIELDTSHYQPRADGMVDEPALRAMLQRTLNKYGSDVVVPEDMFANFYKTFGISRPKRRATGTIPLKDQVQSGKSDLLYHGPVTVGGQRFGINFDTGSADFFIPGPNCSGCNNKAAKYDQGGVNRKSTTSVTYGSGMVSGTNYYDTVTAGGLTAKKTNVISLKKASGFSTSDANGLMGMGFSTIASSKSPTFFENLMAAKKVTKNEFSFYLGRARSGTGQKSELKLGGRNPKHFTGKVTGHKVSKKGYWQIPIDGGFSGSGTPAGAGEAAIDTGTTIILGPMAGVAEFMTTQFGGAPVMLPGNAGITFYSYPCNTNKTLGLAFGGTKYLLNAKDISLGQIANVPLVGAMCVATIAGATVNPSLGPFYVVGDAFLKNWYSIYSYAAPASVSFAKSR